MYSLLGKVTQKYINKYIYIWVGWKRDVIHKQNHMSVELFEIIISLVFNLKKKIGLFFFYESSHNVTV